MFKYHPTVFPSRETMSQVLMNKINHIESLLLEINAKMDNFLGFEDIDDKEKKEITSLRMEVVSEGDMGFQEVFED